jgi:prepilin-type N-terminal cleavage/methylation domain-containing protein
MKKNINAFTLVELVVVIAVIGILAAISIMGLSRYQEIGRDAQRSSSATVIAVALEKYHDSHGEYPSCSAISSTTSPLTELDERVLIAPQADAGVTNSITCADLTGANGEGDYYAFIGDSSPACVNGQSCLQWTLKYHEEKTNTIASIFSRRQVNLAASPAPVLNAAATGYSQVDLTWSANTDAGSYSVQYATNSAFSAGLVVQSSSATSLSITGLTSGTTYYFRVQAVNGQSKSNWSNIKSLTVNFTTLTWKQNTGSGSRNFYGATLSDSGTKMAVTNYNGYIYTSTDSGVTWTEQTSSGIRSWYSIASSADGTKLAAAAATKYTTPTEASAVYLSANSGATWTKSAAPGESTSVAISADGTKVAAAGSSIYASIDSGATWTDRSPNTSGGWSSINSSPNGAILSAKQGNNIYISTNSGATWVIRAAFSSRFAISADGTKLVTATDGGYIYTSTNSGANWTERTAAGSRNWRTFASSSDGSKLVALDNSPGYIYTSIDSGATWVAQTTTGSTYRQGVDSTPDGSKIIIGPSSGYIYTGVYSF